MMRLPFNNHFDEVIKVATLESIYDDNGGQYIAYIKHDGTRVKVEIGEQDDTWVLSDTQQRKALRLLTMLSREQRSD